MACSSVEFSGRPSPSMVWVQSPPRTAASMSGRAFLDGTFFIPLRNTGCGVKRSATFAAFARPSVAAENQRVALAWLVDEVNRDREVDEDLSKSAHVIANLFREKRRVRPCLTEDLGRREVAVGMVEEKLQQRELTPRKGHLLALVPHHPAGRIQVQPVELPESSVPEIQPQLISRHLGLDDLQIDGRRLLGWRLQVGH